MLLGKAKLAAGAALGKLAAWWDGDFRPMSASVFPRQPRLEAAVTAVLPTIGSTPRPVLELVPAMADVPVTTTVFITYRKAGVTYMLPLVLPRDGDLTLPPSPTEVVSVGGALLVPTLGPTGHRRRPLSASLSAPGVGKADVSEVVAMLAGPDGDFHESVGLLPYAALVPQLLGWAPLGPFTLTISDDFGTDWKFGGADTLRLPYDGPPPPPPIPPPPPQLHFPFLGVPPFMPMPFPPAMETLPLPRGIVLMFPDPTLAAPQAAPRNRRSRSGLHK